VKIDKHNFISKVLKCAPREQFDVEPSVNMLID